MHYKAIALDIDGTLLSDAGTVLDSTRRCIATARARDLIIILASGRAVAGLRHLVDVFDLDPTGMVLIGFNGGQATRADTGEVLAEIQLPADLASRIAAHVHDFPVDMMVPQGTRLLTENPDGHNVRAEANGNGLELLEVDDLAALDIPFPKILVAADPVILAEHAPRIAAPFRDEAVFAFSEPQYFEINAPGADKGAGIARAGERLGFRLDEVIAFGDNGNDLTMLRGAGLGVAMGNAIDAAKDAADLVTATNNDDGIALVLEEHLGL